MIPVDCHSPFQGTILRLVLSGVSLHPSKAVRRLWLYELSFGDSCFAVRVAGSAPGSHSVPLVAQLAHAPASRRGSFLAP